ncbi:MULTISPECIES: SMC family ATPase [unclassified Clostridium]|uniref:AAA family ATPase n=1 Tax=unclassified Clostridium TaxID=2614128 RepID=UPI0002979805|nr:MULTISPECIES: SMC family ATPase [unclassified Clostridium]EKQ53589.1 MAG: ATPase involved in DNA repair [Clostridium sp. Maddingley MBC34-26]
MRPIKLRIKGLNSFIDEQTIDFDKLTDRGFFGIFGPTGSGKSTILDGITLALYGNVARKSSNYINTNCERLNVNFEFQISGTEIRRYTIDREFRRKKDGGISSGKCKIVDITDVKEEVLADGVKTINKKVEEILGLNLDDFSRTVVLPQGKFSEFLKLEGKDRRDMLERLFNLQQFGDNLSRKLNAKISKEKTDNSVLLGQLSGYSDVSEEKLKEKEEVLEALRSNLDALKSELDAAQKNYKENEEIWKLQLDLVEYKNKEKELKEREEEIRNHIEKINLGEAGAKVLPYINAYENTIKEFNENETELEKLKSAIDRIKEEKENIEKLWSMAKNNKENKLPQLMLQEQKVKDAMEEKKLLELIQINIDKLKSQIEITSKKCEESQSELLKIDTEIKARNTQIKEDEKVYNELKIDEALKEKVQEGIVSEEKLVNLSLIITREKEKKAFIEKENVETISQGKALREIVDKEVKELENKEGQYDYLIKNPPGDQKDLVNLKQIMVECEQRYKIFNRLINEIDSSKKEIEKLNSEINSKKDEEKKHEEELEKLKNSVKEIMRENLAHTLRVELIEGEECPVCGSTHHVKENIASSIVDLKPIENEIKNKENFIKVISSKIIENETKVKNYNDKIKNNEEEIRTLGISSEDKSLEKLQEEFLNLEKVLDTYAKNKENLEKDISKLRNEVSIRNGEINELRAVVRTNQRQLEELEKSINDHGAEFNNIKSRVDLLKAETLVENFIKKNDEIKQIEKKREELAKAVKLNRDSVEKLEKQKEQLSNELILAKETLTKDKADLLSNEKNKEEKLQSIRNKVNDEADLNMLLDEIQKNIHIINEEFEKLENSKSKIEVEFTESNEKLICAISKYKELSKRKNEEEAQLEVAIDSEGFRSLQDVKNNLIEKEKISEYKARVEAYKDNVSKVKGAIESLQSKINGKEITEEQYIEVKLLRDQKEKEVSDANETKIKIEEELKNIKTKLEEQKDLLEKKAKLEHKLALLSDLEKLFKGKKFVEFVAVNKLKYISIEASKRLKEITHGNYGLEVDEDGKFIIRDYKNGGARRDATTLSGGETFLASLSLALALSAQIQLKGTAPLELFFLDEGFGTLDDELLEVVMNSLERIHNEKMKVGIISHVETIKNRVPVKLMITPAECGMGGSKVKIERN